MGSDLNNCSGTVLIVTLWILVILTSFAIALGQRASLEVKLTEYQRDSLKAIHLAKAAIERAIWEKQNDVQKDLDTLNESWANNQDVFKKYELGDGKFTVIYSLDGITLYGMEDEQSKININGAIEEVLKNLFRDYDNADEIAAAISFWRSKAIEPEEDDHYRNLELPYHCKNEKFKSIAELLLVRGITPAILYGEDKDGDGMISEDEEGIAGYLTVFGSGKININTASTKVLSVLIGGTFLELTPDMTTGLVEKIGAYRKGLDGIIGTTDDQWFSIEGDPAHLSVDNSFFNIYGVTQAEWEKLQILQSTGKLSVCSGVYTIHAEAEVKKVKKIVHATVDLSELGQIEYLSWRQD